MTADAPLDAFVPATFRRLETPSRDLPRIAKDPAAMRAIGAAVKQVPTRHRLLPGDARRAVLPADSVHLVLTSPPYWTLNTLAGHPISPHSRSQPLHAPRPRGSGSPSRTI